MAKNNDEEFLRNMLMGLMMNLAANGEGPKIEKLPETNDPAPHFNQLATNMRSFHMSFIDAGFNEDQAFEMTEILFQGLVDKMLGEVDHQ